ncbi:unnamed protein product [Rotaria sp. Silwood2]|nr:unnamed protein product [Rotaria sp. Silwood2]
MEQPAVWSIIFFIILLLAIVFLPILHPIYLRYTPEKWHKYYIWDCNWKKFSFGLSLSLGYYIYLLNLSYSTAFKMFLFSFHTYVNKMWPKCNTSAALVNRDDQEQQP